MKKILVSFLTVFGSFGFAGHPALAADTGVITLSGSIGVVNEIEITQFDVATSLNIVDGESNALVATVTETSNSPTGYTIYMNSVNDSNLINSANGEETAPYTVSYDGGSPVALTTADLAMKTVGVLGGLVTDESDVLINLTGNSAASSGTFADVITVSIAAN